MLRRQPALGQVSSAFTPQTEEKLLMRARNACEPVVCVYHIAHKVSLFFFFFPLFQEIFEVVVYLLWDNIHRVAQ